MYISLNSNIHISAMKRTFISASDFLKIIVQPNLKHYCYLHKNIVILIAVGYKKILVEIEIY